MGGAAVLAVLLAGCGSARGTAHSAMPGMGGGTASARGASSVSAPTASSGMPTTAGMPGMPGMAAGPPGDGLADTRDGYRLVAAAATLPAGVATRYRFDITAPDGMPVTDFAVDQTRKLHFYAVRSDLSGFQHVHPVMAQDGGWTAALGALTPGRWRLYATFSPASGPGAGRDFVLSRLVTVPGRAVAVPLPAAAPAVGADGYTVTVSGDPGGGAVRPLTVRFTRAGEAVSGLEPYLGAYAHLTAIHAGDMAFAHVHPVAAAGASHGGPELAFHSTLRESGDWRLFLQFQVRGALHVAAVTLHIT
ncbi:hypothetical protein K7862_29625 [Streptomyces sp. PLK6-54]|uniref:YtkA-like domain-containing protein n=1 Tax=Actinacidiphila acidipaludis TaxID=2873382 RepID=A0ABS7QIM0_9ACTN|nr:hypothetical protein [Streptomyces acidipaludis]